METIVTRPWGTYQTIFKTKKYHVKHITVFPHSRLSLQYHNKRSEHWTIVNGTALAQVGADEQILHKNQSIYIPTGVQHRITNNTDKNIILIETQVGDYLEEDDIVRLEDDYNRL